MSTQSPGAGPASDRCPQCGATVIPKLRFVIGGSDKAGELRDPVHQTERCGGCGTALRRVVGEPWKVDDPDA